jgi:hypothetical protein
MERKDHDHVHNSLPLVPIARHMNLIDTLLSYFFNNHFNVIFQHACIFQIVFFSGIPTKIPYAFICSIIHATLSYSQEYFSDPDQQEASDNLSSKCHVHLLLRTSCHRVCAVRIPAQQIVTCWIMVHSPNRQELQ